MADSPRAPRENPFFRRLAELVLAHRLLAALAALGLFGLLGLFARNIKIDNSVEAFMASDSEARHVLERLRDDFGRDDAFLFLIEGEVFSADYLARVHALETEVRRLNLELPSLGERAAVREQKRRLEREGELDEPRPDAALPSQATEITDDFGFEDTPASAGGWSKDEGSIVEDTISIVSVRDTRWVDGAMRIEGLFKALPDPAAPETPARLAAVRDRVLSDPTLVGQVVGKAGRHSVIVVRTDFMSEQDSNTVHEAMVAIARRHQAPGFDVKVAGSPAMGAEINTLMLEDLGVMFGLAIAFIVGSMAFLFRHPLGVLGPMLVVIASLGSTYGLMAAMHVPMTMVTNVLPAFLICASIGDSIHVQSVYRDHRKRGFSNRDAIVRAVALTGMPCLFTTMTTFAGLYSFRTASLEAIRDMGTYGAWGVVFALIYSMVLLPLVLSFNTRSLLGHAADRPLDRLDAALAHCNHASRAHGPTFSRGRAAIFGVVAALLLLSIWGASRIAVHHDPVAWLPENAQARVAIESMNEHLSGTSNIALLIHAKPGKDLRDRDTLLRLERLEAHIRAYRHDDGRAIVGNATSIVDVVREGWKAFHENDPAFARIPETDQGVSDMITIFESRGPEELARLATLDLRTAVMTIRVSQMDAWSYLPLTEHIQAGIREHVGDAFVVETTGTIFNLFTVASALISDLLRSFGWAFVVITIMMLVLLRDVKLGLLATLPNLLPIANVIGLMGLLGIPVDIGTLLIASIALGIAVDDTIHFLHQFRVGLLTSHDTDLAIEHAYSHSGRAMVTTSIILIGGFLVYTASQMINLQRFGLLIALSVLFALLYDIIVAPALLRVFYRRQRHPPEPHPVGVAHVAPT